MASVRDRNLEKPADMIMGILAKIPILRQQNLQTCIFEYSWGQSLNRRKNISKYIFMIRGIFEYIWISIM